MKQVPSTACGFDAVWTRDSRHPMTEQRFGQNLCDLTPKECQLDSIQGFKKVNQQSEGVLRKLLASCSQPLSSVYCEFGGNTPLVPFYEERIEGKEDSAPIDVGQKNLSSTSCPRTGALIIETHQASKF